MLSSGGVVHWLGLVASGPPLIGCSPNCRPSKGLNGLEHSGLLWSSMGSPKSSWNQLSLSDSSDDDDELASWYCLFMKGHPLASGAAVELAAPFSKPAELAAVDRFMVTAADAAEGPNAGGGLLSSLSELSASAVGPGSALSTGMYGCELASAVVIVVMLLPSLDAAEGPYAGGQTLPSSLSELSASVTAPVVRSLAWTAVR